ncbi:hypothetical protein ACHAO4_010176 [Trichoderma viride]
MAALAAIYNPLAPKDKGVNLFFNTSNAQVALTLKTGTDGSDPDNDAYTAGDDDYPGHILNPSEISGGSFRGVHHVIATTIPLVAKGASVTNNQISLVSPVYKKLSTTALANKNTAFSSFEKGAWAGTANNQTKLKEYNFLTQHTATYLPNGDIRLNSSLAAYYNTKNGHRYVIYQEVNQNHLKEFDITSGQSYDIDCSEGAVQGTTIAATYANGKVYIYYVDGGANIRRIIKTGDSGWSGNHRVENAAKITIPGQLTVTTANGFNHLFYVSVDNALDTNDFSHVVDEIQE